MKALVIGSTGATGTELTKQLIEHEEFTEVRVFVRNVPKINHPKLNVHKVDFNEISSWSDQLTGDVLFLAMGTTLKTAGSKEAQYKVDVTYQYEVAKAAAKNNVSKLILVSSVGASSNSIFFYPKIKGKLEEMVKKLNFKSICILRPPVIDRGESMMRPTERKTIAFIKRLNKFGLLVSQKPITSFFLARKMVELVNKETIEKTIILEPKDIFNLK
tara:strand:+ start:176 stop:823 length:648 start_codon:yes stop_codon:yes gene_type:complete